MTQTEVDHPSHYNNSPSGIECIDVVEHMNFNRGNAVKYIWRAGDKGDPVTDLAKARWYLDREIERQDRLQAQHNERDEQRRFEVCSEYFAVAWDLQISLTAQTDERFRNIATPLDVAWHTWRKALAGMMILASRTVLSHAMALDDAFRHLDLAARAKPFSQEEHQVAIRQVNARSGEMLNAMRDYLDLPPLDPEPDEVA